MAKHDDRGMATAEYTIGTVAAVMIASVLIKFGLLDNDNPWMDAFRDLLDQALGWSALRDMFSGFRFRIR